MNTLIAGFEGNDNSAKIILDKISTKTVCDKLYLKNDFSKCYNQLVQILENKTYDFLFAFGQKPVIKKIYIERMGRDTSTMIETDFDYNSLSEYLREKNYEVKISDNAGNYLCNHIFYNGLFYIHNNKLNTKMIFIHIPYLSKIADIDVMAIAFSDYIDSLTK